MKKQIACFNLPIADRDGPLAHVDDGEVRVARVVDVGNRREDAAAQRRRLHELAGAEQVCSFPDPSFTVWSDQPILLLIHDK